MSLLKTLPRILLITLIFFIAAQNLSYADGGFPVRPGRLLISPSVSYFFATSEWDAAGVKKPFPDNGNFNSVGFTLYSEYGISKRFAVVATLPFVYNNYTFTQNSAIATKSSVSSGLTDLETGIRYYLANIDFHLLFLYPGHCYYPFIY